MLFFVVILSVCAIYGVGSVTNSESKSMQSQSQSHSVYAVNCESPLVLSAFTVPYQSTPAFMGFVGTYHNICHQKEGASVRNTAYGAVGAGQVSSTDDVLTLIGQIQIQGSTPSNAQMWWLPLAGFNGNNQATNLYSLAAFTSNYTQLKLSFTAPNSAPTGNLIFTVSYTRAGQCVSLANYTTSVLIIANLQSCNPSGVGYLYTFSIVSLSTIFGPILNDRKLYGSNGNGFISLNFTFVGSTAPIYNARLVNLEMTGAHTTYMQFMMLDINSTYPWPAQCGNYTTATAVGEMNLLVAAPEPTCSQSHSVSHHSHSKSHDSHSQSESRSVYTPACDSSVVQSAFSTPAQITPPLVGFVGESSKVCFVGEAGYTNEWYSSIGAGQEAATAMPLILTGRISVLGVNAANCSLWFFPLSGWNGDNSNPNKVALNIISFTVNPALQTFQFIYIAPVATVQAKLVVTFSYTRAGQCTAMQNYTTTVTATPSSSFCANLGTNQNTWTFNVNNVPSFLVPIASDPLLYSTHGNGFISVNLTFYGSTTPVANARLMSARLVGAGSVVFRKMLLDLNNTYPWQCGSWAALSAVGQKILTITPVEPSCSESESHSKSHESDSKSHHSDSKSRHSHSHSKSHDSHSDSHSLSKSHHSDSHSKSHESDSHSKSHHSDSHSKSHHSDSQSKSHHSDSHSKSHESTSLSKSHHSESHSKSHESDSHSKSHHSDSSSQSLDPTRSSSLSASHASPSSTRSVYHPSARRLLGDYTCSATIQNFGHHSLIVNNINGSNGVCMPPLSIYDGVLEQNVTAAAPLVFGGQLMIYGSGYAIMWGTPIDNMIPLNIQIAAAVNYGADSAPYCDPQVILQVLLPITPDYCQYSLDITPSTIVCAPISTQFLSDFASLSDIDEFCGVNLTGNVIDDIYACDLSGIDIATHLLQVIVSPPTNNASCAGTVYSQMFSTFYGFNITDGQVAISLVNRTEGCVPTDVPACVPPEFTPSPTPSASPGPNYGDYTCGATIENFGANDIIINNRNGSHGVCVPPLPTEDGVFQQNITDARPLVFGGAFVAYNSSAALMWGTLIDPANNILIAMLASVNYGAASSPYCDPEVVMQVLPANTRDNCQYSLDITPSTIVCQRIAGGFVPNGESFFHLEDFCGVNISGAVIEDVYSCNVSVIPVGAYVLQAVFTPPPTNASCADAVYSRMFTIFNWMNTTGGQMPIPLVNRTEGCVPTDVPACVPQSYSQSASISHESASLSPSPACINTFRNTGDAPLVFLNAFVVDNITGIPDSCQYPIIYNEYYSPTQPDDIKLTGPLVVTPGKYYQLFDARDAVSQFASFEVRLIMSGNISADPFVNGVMVFFSYASASFADDYPLCDVPYAYTTTECTHVDSGGASDCDRAFFIGFERRGDAVYNCSVPDLPVGNYLVELAIEHTSLNDTESQIFLSHIQIPNEDYYSYEYGVHLMEPVCTQFVVEPECVVPGPVGNLTCTPDIQNYGPNAFVINDMNATGDLCRRGLYDYNVPDFDGILATDVSASTPLVFAGTYKVTTGDETRIFESSTLINATYGIVIDVLASLENFNATLSVAPVVVLTYLPHDIPNTCDDSYTDAPPSVVCTPTGDDEIANGAQGLFYGQPVVCGVNVSGPIDSARYRCPLNLTFGVYTLKIVFVPPANQPGMVYPQLFTLISGTNLTGGTAPLTFLPQTEGCRPLTVPGCTFCGHRIRNSGSEPLVFLPANSPSNITNVPAQCRQVPLIFNEHYPLGYSDDINITTQWDVADDGRFRMFEMPSYGAQFKILEIDVATGFNLTVGTPDTLGVRVFMSYALANASGADGNLPCDSNAYTTIECGGGDLSINLCGGAMSYDYFGLGTLGSRYLCILPDVAPGAYLLQISVIHTNFTASQIFLTSILSGNITNRTFDFLPFIQPSCSEFVLSPECVPPPITQSYSQSVSPSPLIPIGHRVCTPQVENFGSDPLLIDNYNGSHGVCARIGDHITPDYVADGTFGTNVSVWTPFIFGGPYQMINPGFLVLWNTPIDPTQYLFVDVLSTVNFDIVDSYYLILQDVPEILLQIVPDFVPGTCPRNTTISAETILCVPISGEYSRHGDPGRHNIFCGVNYSNPYADIKYVCNTTLFALTPQPGTLQLIVTPAGPNATKLLYEQMYVRLRAYSAIFDSLIAIPLLFPTQNCTAVTLPPCTPESPSESHSTSVYSHSKSVYSQSQSHSNSRLLTRHCAPTIENFGPNSIIINNVDGAGTLCPTYMSDYYYYDYTADAVIDKNVTDFNPFTIGGRVSIIDPGLGEFWGTYYDPSQQVLVNVLANVNFPSSNVDYYEFYEDIPLVILQPIANFGPNECPRNISIDADTIVCAVISRDYHPFGIKDPTPQIRCGVNESRAFVDIRSLCDTSLLGVGADVELDMVIFPYGVNSTSIVYSNINVRVALRQNVTDDYIQLSFLNETYGCEPVKLPGCVVQSASQSASHESQSPSQPCAPTLRNSGDEPLLFLNYNVPDTIAGGGTTCPVYQLAFNEYPDVGDIEYINITGKWIVTGNVTNPYYQMFEMPAPEPASPTWPGVFTGLTVTVIYAATYPYNISDYGVSASLAVQTNPSDYGLPCQSDTYALLDCPLSSSFEFTGYFLDEFVCPRITNYYERVISLTFACRFYVLPPAVDTHEPVQLSIVHNRTLVPNSQVFLGLITDDTNTFNVPFMPTPCREYVLGADCGVSQSASQSVSHQSVSPKLNQGNYTCSATVKNFGPDSIFINNFNGSNGICGNGFKAYRSPAGPRPVRPYWADGTLDDNVTIWTPMIFGGPFNYIEAGDAVLWGTEFYAGRDIEVHIIATVNFYNFTSLPDYTADLHAGQEDAPVILIQLYENRMEGVCLNNITNQSTTITCHAYSWFVIPRSDYYDEDYVSTPNEFCGVPLTHDTALIDIWYTCDLTTLTTSYADLVMQIFPGGANASKIVYEQMYVRVNAYSIYDYYSYIEIPLVNRTEGCRPTELPGCVPRVEGCTPTIKNFGVDPLLIDNYNGKGTICPQGGKSTPDYADGILDTNVTIWSPFVFGGALSIIETTVGEIWGTFFDPSNGLFVEITANVNFPVIGVDQDNDYAALVADQPTVILQTVPEFAQGECPRNTTFSPDSIHCTFDEVEYVVNGYILISGNPVVCGVNHSQIFVKYLFICDVSALAVGTNVELDLMIFPGGLNASKIVFSNFYTRVLVWQNVTEIEIPVTFLEETTPCAPVTLPPCVPEMSPSASISPSPSILRSHACSATIENFGADRLLISSVDGVDGVCTAVIPADRYYYYDGAFETNVTEWTPLTFGAPFSVLEDGAADLWGTFINPTLAVTISLTANVNFPSFGFTPDYEDYNELAEDAPVVLLQLLYDFSAGQCPRNVSITADTVICALRGRFYGERSGRGHDPVYCGVNTSQPFIDVTYQCDLSALPVGTNAEAELIIFPSGVNASKIVYTHLYVHVEAFQNASGYRITVPLLNETEYCKAVVLPPCMPQIIETESMSPRPSPSFGCRGHDMFMLTNSYVEGEEEYQLVEGQYPFLHPSYLPNCINTTLYLFNYDAPYGVPQGIVDAIDITTTLDVDVTGQYKMFGMHTYEHAIDALEVEIIARGDFSVDQVISNLVVTLYYSSGGIRSLRCHDPSDYTMVNCSLVATSDPCPPLTVYSGKDAVNVFSCPLPTFVYGVGYKIELSVYHDNIDPNQNQTFIQQLLGVYNNGSSYYVIPPYDISGGCVGVEFLPQCPAILQSRSESQSISHASPSCEHPLRDSGASQLIFLNQGVVDEFTFDTSQCNLSPLVYAASYDAGADFIGVLGALLVDPSGKWVLYGMDPADPQTTQNLYISIYQGSNDDTSPAANGVQVFFVYAPSNETDGFQAPCHIPGVYTTVNCTAAFSVNLTAGGDCTRAQGGSTYLWRTDYDCLAPILTPSTNYMVEILVAHTNPSSDQAQVFLGGILGEYFNESVVTFPVPIFEPACSEYSIGSECPPPTPSQSESPERYVCEATVQNYGALPMVINNVNGTNGLCMPNWPASVADGFLERGVNHSAPIVFGGDYYWGSPTYAELWGDTYIDPSFGLDVYIIASTNCKGEDGNLPTVTLQPYPLGTPDQCQYTVLPNRNGTACMPVSAYCQRRDPDTVDYGNPVYPTDELCGVVNTQNLLVAQYHCDMSSIYRRRGYSIGSVLQLVIDPPAPGGPGLGYNQTFVRLEAHGYDGGPVIEVPLVNPTTNCRPITLPACGYHSLSDSQSESPSRSHSRETRSHSQSPEFGCVAPPAVIRDSSPGPLILVITQPSIWPRPGFYPMCIDGNELIFNLNSDYSALTLGEPDNIRITTTLTVLGGENKLFDLHAFQYYFGSYLLEILSNGNFASTQIINNVTVTMSWASQASCIDQVPCSFPTAYTIVQCSLVDWGWPCETMNETANWYQCNAPELPDGVYLIEFAILHANVDPTQSQIFLDNIYGVYEFYEGWYALPFLDMNPGCEGVVLTSACVPCDSGLVRATQPYVMEFVSVPTHGGPVPEGFPLCNDGTLAYNRDFMLGNQNIGILGPYFVDTSSFPYHFSMFATPTPVPLGILPDTLVVKILATGNFIFSPPLETLSVYLSVGNASSAHDEAPCNAPYGSYIINECSLDSAGYGCGSDYYDTQAYYIYNCPLPITSSGDYLVDLTILSPDNTPYEMGLFLDTLDAFLGPFTGGSYLTFVPFMNTRCAIGVNFSLTSECAGPEPETPCDDSGHTNLMAFQRGSVLETFNDSASCFVDYMLTPAGNMFQGFVGFSIPVDLFDSTPPISVSFMVISYGGPYIPQNTFFMSYTTTCGTYDIVNACSSTTPTLTFDTFPEDCPVTYAQEGNTLPLGSSAFNINHCTSPIPPGARSLDIVFTNVPGNIVFYIGDILIQTDDYSVSYDITDEPCTPTLLPAATCQCVECAHCVGASI